MINIYLFLFIVLDIGYTLIEDICNVFNITLAEFYSDIDFDKLTSKEIVLLEAFRNVSDEDKQRVIEIVKLFENKQNK